MEYKKRETELIKEAEGLLKRKNEAVAIVNQCDSRVLEIQGAVKELRLLSKPEKDKKKKA